MLETAKESLKNYLSAIFIFILTVFALWLRLINLGRLSFWSDDCFTYLAVEGILKYGYPKLASGLIYFKQILYSYLVAFFAFFSGLNEFSLRLPSVLAGILVIPLIYKFTKDLFNRPTAIVASIFMAFNYWSFEFSREARYYTTLQLFYLAGVYFFYLGFIKENKKFKILTVITFIASIFILRLSLFLILNFLFLIIFKGFKAIFKKENFFSFLIILAIFASSLIFEIFFWQVGRHVKHTGSLSGIFSELITPNANFLRQFEWLFKRMYLVILAGFIGYLLNLIKFFKHIFLKKEPEQKVLFLNWTFIGLNFFIPLFLMSFGNAHYQPRYVFYLLPFFAILYSQAAYFLAEIITAFLKIILKSYFNQTFYKILCFTFFCLIIVISIKNVSISHLIKITNRVEGQPIDSRFAPSTANRFHHDFKSSALFVKKFLKPEDIVISMYAAYHYIYAQRVDFWLWSMSEEGWPAFHFKNGKFFDNYTGVELLRSLDDLKSCLNKFHNHRIWIISTYSINEPGHIAPEIKNFLKNSHQDKIVYTNPAGDSSVWLWPEGKNSI